MRQRRSESFPKFEAITHQRFPRTNGAHTRYVATIPTMSTNSNSPARIQRFVRSGETSLVRGGDSEGIPIEEGFMGSQKSLRNAAKSLCAFTYGCFWKCVPG